MANIVVSATSLRSSGGLTILKQFISHIPDSDDKYYIFIDESVNLEKKRNVVYIKRNTRSQLKRLLFDFYSLRKEIKKRKVNPDLLISLQNNAVRYDASIPQLVYYHIPLPVFPNKWNPFKRNERGMYIYKYLYSLIIRMSDSVNVHYSAQIPYIKEGMIRNLGIDADRINVYVPDCPSRIKETHEIEKTNVFLYPATSLIYKNHRIIVEAIKILLEQYPELKGNIKVVFTINNDDDNEVIQLINEYGLNDIFVVNGPVPYNIMLDYYKKATALLFPSYIETFGLPLLEAAAYGLPVFASDLRFAHDVIGEYEGARFIQYDNPYEWAMAIKDIIKTKKIYSPFLYRSKKGWPDLFKQIENMSSSSIRP